MITLRFQSQLVFLIIDNNLFLLTAIIASVFCVCLANVDNFDGFFQLLLIIVIIVSAAISTVIMLMLYRLPQAIESLSFKVNIFDNF